MTTFDSLVKQVSAVCPQFNDYALRGFVKEHINNTPKFIEIVFREGIKLINADMELVDYEFMSPEDRVKFELRSTPGKPTKTKIPLTVSHMSLVRYRIRFGNNYIYPKLYTPYLFEDMLCIGDKKSIIRKVLNEKTVSRVQDKDKDGISVSPIRVNMTFNRKHTFKIQSYTSGEYYRHFIVAAKMFHGEIRNKICTPTIAHYMLAKFGFLTTLKKFGINPADMLFAAEVGKDQDEFEYFAAKQFDEKEESGPGLFFKVRRSLLLNDQMLKFVVNVMYVLWFFKIQTIDNVYVEEGSIWKIMLGAILYENKAEPKAYYDAETHLRSADDFIDPLTRERFRRFDVPINDIYDLLVYIFINIDSFMVNSVSQNIYDSRLDVSNGILVETFARGIFNNFYYLLKKTNITLQDVESHLSFSPMMFKLATSGKKDDSEHYIAPPEIIGDNFLFSGGLNKIRLGGKAEQRLHPSMAVCESIGAFVGKDIGKTGYLNPYIPTDKYGAIIRPDYADQIDSLKNYLPR